MKILKLFIILSALCFISNCSKDKKDFREKYTGKWFFKVNRSEFNTDSIGFHKEDSVEFIGQVELVDNKNEIKIQYTKDNTITAEINEVGEFIFPSPHKSGSFDGISKVHIYLFWGGLGGGTTHIVDGVKQ